MALTNIYRCQVRWGMDSGVPEDASVNTFHFVKTTAGTATVAELGVPEGWIATWAQGVDSYLSSLVNPADVTQTWYHLADPEPRQPLHKIAIAAITTGTNVSPAEVALCMSYASLFVSGEAAARRRGRTYIGPLASSQFDTATGRPAPGIISGVQAAAAALLASSNASADWKWVVYSRVRAEEGALVPYSFVTNGWIDNEWDIQRRRGLRPTTRTTF